MKKVAIVRGKFLNAYEMQIFTPLSKRYDITAFGSLSAYHSKFSFPVQKLPSPVDLPDFPYKMPLLNRFFIDAHYLYGLEKVLRGFDIVHTAETYFHYTQQALNAKKSGHIKKVIATVLENIPFNNEGIWGRRSFKKRAREELDHIIALTNRTKEALILEGADSEKITVVSHGIDTKRFIPKRNFLHNNKNQTDFTILFSGRLEVIKGVYEVIYAAKLLLLDPQLKKFRMRFLVVGNGKEKDSLIALEKKLGIESFIKHKELSYNKMPMIYQQADLFWAPGKPTPTYQEQYCTALLEAQSAGLPIVTTSVGGIPENIGNAGIIVGAGDFFALKEAMKAYILKTNLRTFYSKRARERAVNVHDVGVIAKQISTIYEKVL